jgi:hypothetical protein
MRTLVILALLTLCCSTQQLQDAAYLGFDSNGQLLISDGVVNVTLREVHSMVAQLSSLSALVASHSALVKEVCRVQGRFSTFQSVLTQGAMDWEFFNIGTQSFLAVAEVPNSQILRFDGSSFVPFQLVPTVGAVDWEFFTMGNQSYLAVANHRNSATFSQNSQILRFDSATNTFLPFQSIPTQGAFDWEFFNIAGHSYLAVANHRSDSSWTINSQIFRFNGSTFLPFQSIPSVGAQDWLFFNIAGHNYLALANRYDGNIGLVPVNSQIFRFNGSSFVLFQSISIVGGWEWEFFTMQGESYLAAANQYDDQLLTSQILRFNGSSFVVFQSIPTVAAFDWEFFRIGTQSYLALANRYTGNTYSINSQIFWFNGTTFVPFQLIPTVGAVDWKFFTIGTQSFLAVANNYDGNTYSLNSQIFRLASPCFE